MTEPENFEDDLFADLYNDDEPAPQPEAPADQPAAAQQPAADDSYDPAQDSNQQLDDQNGQDSYMNQGDGAGADEDDDDEVDFNLGNGNSTAHHDNDHEEGHQGYGIPQQQHHGHRGPNSKEDGKMFIGGLNWETTDQSLRDYFSQFGEVIECTVMRDGATGRSRGFGFLTFKDPKTVNIVMVKEHYLDGKIIDPKRAIPRDEQEKTSKIFVGGVSQETTDHEFREYFAHFGRVVDATLMMDKDTGRPRGFGFVTFESDAAVEACLAANLEIHGKPIEVKRAQPRGNMREEEEAAARRGGGGKFGRKGAGNQGGQGMDDGSGGMGGGMGGMGGGAGPGGMTPQVMAQYLQRMQQYFAMMQQQQMAMNRGAMNPAMMQMMQMQQMQQMQQMMAAQQGRGGAAGANPMAGAMGQINPQQMQQMQQMQQQMMQQQQQQQQQGQGQQGGGAPGGGSMSPVGNAGGAAAGSMSPAPQGGATGGSQYGGSNSGGGGGNNEGPGFNNAFDQQQQPFQQQPQQQRRGNNNYRNNQQQNFGGGGGYGGPTSWEGMYDDVPQPMMNQGGMNPGMNQGYNNMGGGRGGYHHKNRGAYQPHHNQNVTPADPNAAPPPNAPTGPKNAGRPGANYRGGGRGGNRGFHPYSR